MKCTEDKMQKCGKIIRTLGAAMTVALLAGCSGSRAQEAAHNETEPEERTSVTLEFSDITRTETQENPVRQNPAEETETQETGTTQPEPEVITLKLASEDWGLSFGEPGTQPVGNALPEDLAWYDAYFVGDGSEKVIYLTFDCGYENGNTGAILDALKKHNVQATFLW